MLAIHVYSFAQCSSGVVRRERDGHCSVSVCSKRSIRQLRRGMVRVSFFQQPLNQDLELGPTLIAFPPPH